jgi:hypothetical protein
MKRFKINILKALNSIFNIGLYKELFRTQRISRLVAFSILMYLGTHVTFAQLTSSSSQTISTNQTYTGTSTIYNSSTVTVSAGTTTFTGTLTVGNGGTGALIVKSGAIVIVNGTLAIGTSSNGAVTIESGGQLIVNPGSAGGTAAINVNSSAATALDIKTGGSVIVNAASAGNTILGMYQTSASNTNVAGSLQIRGGGFKMDNTSKLTYSGSGNDTIIGNPNAQGAYFSNSTVLTVGSSVNLYISGNVNNDSNANFAINGNVAINGNYQSGNTTANITGTGTVTTTGSLDADGNQGTVFGQHYSCATGPCGGNSLIASSNTTTCGGGVVDITGVAYSGATYQWLVSTTSASSGFSNASAPSTGQNYSTTGSSSVQYTYYKRQYTLSGQTFNSNTLTITSNYWVNAPTVAAITGPSSVCSGSTITLADATSGGTWSSATPTAATIASSGVVTGVSPGTSVVSYSVTSGGCTGAKSTTITVTGLPVTTAITSTGTYTVPSGAKAVQIQVWGAGGGGSKGYSNLKGTGGGGGGFSQKTMNVTAGSTLSVTIGTGGTGASTSGNGSGGGTSSVSSGSVVASATGGSGGQSTAAPDGIGGISGTGVIGDFTFNGGSGTNLVIPTASSPGGGGGSSAGTAANGSSGSGNLGGSAVTGGGTGGDGNSAANGNGAVGSIPGGGGGGNAGTGNGGNGGDGRVIITVYYTSITYPSSSLCKTATSSLPVIDGVTGGTFSSTTGLIINSSTGDINPSTSTVGNYTVSYSNSCGVIATTFVKIIAAPTATAGGSQSICYTGTATVSGATSSNGTIAWTSNGAGSITSGASTLTPVYSAATADAGNTVTLTITVSSGSCTNATATYSVVVKASPTATAGGSQTICKTGTATVSGATSSNGTIAWTENGSGSITSGASTLTPVYTPSSGDAGNTVTLTMTVSNSPCANATAIYAVSVNAIPTASAGGSQTICQSTAATVSGATSSSGTIAWTTNGAGSITSGATTTTPTYISVAADGGNTVTLTMTVSNSPCTNATATYSVIVSTCARTWTGATNTAWATSGNWSPSNVPTSIDNVVIPSSVASGRMPTISTSTNAKSVTNSGTITFTSAGTLNASGNISNTGTVTTVSGSTVSFNGSSAQTLTGVSALYNVQIANTSGGVSLSSALTVKGALTLTSGVLTTNSNLTINFDNGGNIAYNASDAGSISGDVSGRRDAIARTHYIAAPFSGVTSTQVDVNSPLFYNGYWKMYAKDFTTQGWTAVMAATAGMPLGTGFSLAMPAAAPIILSGTYSHTYSYTGTSYSNAAAAKYMLIGNPYPSALDWDAATGWTKTNIGGSVYYWNAATSSASSYNNGISTNGGTRYIPAMQSFMVTTTGTGGNSSISISNAARVNLQNPSYFRISSDGIIRIKLTGSNPDNWDDAVIRFNESATTSFDNDWDAYKIISRGPSPLIYTSLKGQTYSINSVSGVDSLPAVDVVVYLPSDGNYTLNIDNSDPTIDYILVDKKLGTDNQVTDAGYTFTGSATDDVNRFQLQLRTAQTTGTQSGKGTQGLSIYSSTKGFVIQTNQFGGEQADIEILDMTGNSVKIMSNSSLSTGSTYFPMDLSAGAYLVKVTVDGNVFTGIVSLIR